MCNNDPFIHIIIEHKMNFEGYFRQAHGGLTRLIDQIYKVSIIKEGHFSAVCCVRRFRSMALRLLG
jgi:hypothetical protein